MVINKVNKVIAGKIKRLREGQGLTQDFFASELKMKQGSYSKLESGKINFTITQLKTIADLLGVPLESLVGQQDEKVSFNHSNNNTANSLVINPQVPSHEKQLYEDHIATLKAEVIYLRGKFDDCMNNKP